MPVLNNIKVKLKLFETHLVFNVFFCLKNVAKIVLLGNCGSSYQYVFLKQCLRNNNTLIPNNLTRIFFFYFGLFELTPYIFFYITPNYLNNPSTFRHYFNYFELINKVNPMDVGFF